MACSRVVQFVQRLNTVGGNAPVAACRQDRRATAARLIYGRLFILRREALAPMHESLEQVQSKIAYLERAMAELSDVVFRQHGEIQALQSAAQGRQDRLEVAPSEEGRSAEQERPPHY